MVVIGDVILSKIIEKVVELGFNYLSHGCQWQSGDIMDELQSLRDALPSIKAVVEVAESTPEQIAEYPSLRGWLQQLKDAIYEADDVMDDLEYFRLEQQVALSEEEASSKSKVCSLIPHRFKKKVISFNKCAFKVDPTLNKLKRVIKRLNKVASNVGNFLAILGSNPHHHEAQINSDRESGPQLTESIVFGRDKEKEILLQWLKKEPGEADQYHEGSSNHNNVSLFSIVGHGGMGKTTLAQLVFNDQSIQSSFGPKIWLCVSTSSDVKVLTAAMLESVTGKRPELTTLATLQDALRNELISSKTKYLLVLDDAWDNIPNWQMLLAPLKYGSKGSKILLTTRMDQVAESAAWAIGGGTKKSMKLESLEDDAFFQLFKRRAFAGKKFDDYPKLHSIGKQIAEKLGGSPLAAKVLGALLNQNLNELYWNNILHTNFLDHASERGADIKLILMLTYQSLPAYLRPCFVHCSTFPQDYQFEKEVLVHIWIALGLIQQTHQNPRDVLEDVGSFYFDELVKSSFLEPYHHSDTKFVMHDLLHELDRSVSNGECVGFVGDELEEDLPNTILHLYLQTNNINLLAKLNKLKNLHTLVFRFTGKSDSSTENANVFKRVIKSLKSVHVLLLRGWSMRMKVVGDAISNLTHLRFLSFYVFNDDSNEMNKFLKSICELYHLQILNNERGVKIDFPKSINRLINLRHLKPIVCSRNILGIGRLVNLQELIFFVRKERGYNIAQLKNLNQLRELEIGGLENVLSCREASMAELHKKGKLQKLKLMWTPGFTEMGKDEEILDGLHVPSGVKNLVIKGYGGCRSANWMEIALRKKQLEHVEDVELNECSRWELLPPLERLPYLKHLKLEKMPAVKKIDSEDGYAELKVLEIAEMEQLEEWSLTDSTSKGGIYQWCPRLARLTIKGCPKLQVLLSLPFSLTSLELEDVGLTVLPTFSSPPAPCSNITSACSSSSSSSGPSLSVLEIYNCKRLTSLSEGLLQQNLVTLKKLWIRICEELVALPVQGLRHLGSLEDLYIENCPKLQVLPSLPFSLTSLKLKNVGLTVLPTFSPPAAACSSSSSSGPSLSSLSEGLLQQNLVALRRLEIINCEVLVALPVQGFRHLCSLEELTIHNCPKLQQQQQQQQQEVASSGEDGYYLLPSSLKKLYFERCGDWVRSLPTSLQGGLTSLQSLYLFECESLTSLPSKEVWRTLTSLKKLRIRRCPNIVAQQSTVEEQEKVDFTSTIEELWIDDPSLLLLIDPLRSLTSVRELLIIECGKLESMDGELERWLLQNSSSLQELYFLNAVSLKSLPCTLQTLSSLQQLAIFNATSLESVPQLPSSLNFLYITGCNDTLKERLKKDEGADWTHIKHIPRIHVYSIENEGDSSDD